MREILVFLGFSIVIWNQGLINRNNNLLHEHLHTIEQSCIQQEIEG